MAAVTATDQSEIDAETPLMEAVVRFCCMMARETLAHLEAGLTSSSAILLRDLLGKV